MCNAILDAIPFQTGADMMCMLLLCSGLGRRCQEGAASKPSLAAAHDSGFRQLAKPYRIKDFHLQSLADLARRTGCPSVFWWLVK